MCSRYTQSMSAAQLAQRFSATAAEGFSIPDAPEFFPAQEAPVVALGTGGRRLGLMRWGLIPSWAKEEAFGRKTFNARAETAAEKPSFRDALAKRRCLVPAAGFFEWISEPGAKNKTKLRFHRKDGEAFAMAGLWDRWKAPDGRQVLSFTILTAAANAAVAPIHERMPVILAPADEDRWLAGGGIPAPLSADELTHVPA